MGSDGVVMLSPAFDEHLGLIHGVENLRVQQLVPELSVDGEDGPAPLVGPYSLVSLRMEEHSQ